MNILLPFLGQKINKLMTAHFFLMVVEFAVSKQENKNKQSRIETLNSKVVKVAFSQKGLMHLSFLQTGKPNYFPELKF